MEYAHIRAFRNNPAKVWALLKEMDAVITAARPTRPITPWRHWRPGACCSASSPKTSTTCTARPPGTDRVVEYHGNAHRFICDTCRGQHPRETLDFSPTLPYIASAAASSGLTSLFGEAIPAAAQTEAEELAKACDLLLVIGTSGEVAPAGSPLHRQGVGRGYRRNGPGTVPPA